MKTLLLLMMLFLLQPSVTQLCSCISMVSFTDGEYASSTVSYTVEQGGGCCSGSPSGSGVFVDLYFNSGGQLVSSDYCETSASMAQSYCC